MFAYVVIHHSPPGRFKRMRSVCIMHYQPTSSVVGMNAAYVKRNLRVAHWSAPERRENAKEN